MPINTFTSSFTGIYGSEGIAVDSHGQIYLANFPGAPSFQGGSISIFAPGSYATTAPASVIEGDNTGLNIPQSIAVDASGNISALNIDGTITVYPAGSTGNVTPSATISLNNIDPSGIARGSDGELYVADQGFVQCNQNGRCHQTSVGSVDVYPANANGNANPSAVIAGYATGIAAPSAIAVSKRGNIFVANQGPMACACGCFPTGPGSITVYAPGSAANAKPIAKIQGALTQIGIPEGVAVDSTENIYVFDEGGIGGVGNVLGAPGRVVCFDEGSAVEQALVRNRTSGLSDSGDVFFTREVGTFEISGQPSILVFKAGSNGNTPPMSIIRGPFTALRGSGIALGPSGP